MASLTSTNSQSAYKLPTPDLRKELRARRRSLSSNQQSTNSHTAAKHLVRSGIILRYRSIAIYQARDGELDPSPVADICFEQRKKIYLPVLRHDKKQALWFFEYQPGDVMLKNRFGIEEPMANRQQRIAPWGLGLILLPLVGFDLEGNRIGMGGGYYDRTLAFLKHRNHWHRPTLIGMAHDCQRLPRIEVRAWDIPLDGILTESGLHLVNKKTV